MLKFLRLPVIFAFNMLKFKELTFLGMELIGMFFISYPLHAQQKFRPKNIPELDSHHCHMFRWKVNLVVNSNPQNGLFFTLKSKSTDLYYWITESGALIASVDSLRSKPIATEKRNEYPFHPWEKGKEYRILLPRKPDSDGWFRCQWREVATNRVLDEIWHCSMKDNDDLELVRWETIGQVFIVEK